LPSGSTLGSPRRSGLSAFSPPAPWPSAIDWNDEKSSPAQNDGPSPLSTTARSPGACFSDSPASFSAANMAPSSALRLSGRFRRTSAMPLLWLIVTRSDMAEVCQVIP